MAFYIHEIWETLTDLYIWLCVDNIKICKVTESVSCNAKIITYFGAIMLQFYCLLCILAHNKNTYRITLGKNFKSSHKAHFAVSVYLLHITRAVWRSTDETVLFLEVKCALPKPSQWTFRNRPVGDWLPVCMHVCTFHEERRITSNEDFV